MFTYNSLDFGPKNQTDVMECCRQSNDALDEDKYFVFLTFYGESSSVRDSWCLWVLEKENAQNEWMYQIMNEIPFFMA